MQLLRDGLALLNGNDIRLDAQQTRRSRTATGGAQLDRELPRRVLDAVKVKQDCAGGEQPLRGVGRDGDGLAPVIDHQCHLKWRPEIVSGLTSRLAADWWCGDNADGQARSLGGLALSTEETRLIAALESHGQYVAPPGTLPEGQKGDAASVGGNVVGGLTVTVPRHHGCSATGNRKSVSHGRKVGLSTPTIWMTVSFGNTIVLEYLVIGELGSRAVRPDQASGPRVPAGATPSRAA